MKDLLDSLQGMFPADCRERIFLVGGTVRDFLAGKGSEDIDLVATLPDETLHRCGFRLVEGKTTAPIWFRYDCAMGKIEVIQLNDDATLLNDLLRRDFTINAIAMQLTGELHDPLQGRDAMGDGMLRPCSESTFRDDPLRIFRAFRFEANGWLMSPETEELIRKDDWALKLRSIPVERFSREMLKALAGKEPARFFQRMWDFNVGREWLPELFRMPLIPAGPPEHHPEIDLFSHSVQTLQRAAAASTDTLTRFCAFFHDIGKLATEPALYPKHQGHDEAGFGPALDFCNRLCLPAAYRKALSWTSRLHLHLCNWDGLRDTTRIRIAEQATKAGIATILPLVAAADKPNNPFPSGWEDALEAAARTTAELGIEIDRLSVMPVDNRNSFILQKRVEMLRRKRKEAQNP